MSKKHKIQIAPSIFASDLGQLAAEAKRIEEAGADAIHYDIMDGHFVPNLSLSALSLAAVNRATDLFLDVHIMVYNPFDYIEPLVKSGADRITFHLEATEDVEDTIEYIKKAGIEVGISICPETSTELLFKYISMVDLILIMTVHPGFSGQKFIEEGLDRVKTIRTLCDEYGIRKGGVLAKDNPNAPPQDIQVDGGIDDKTAAQCIEAGANVLVAGSYLFKGGKLDEKIAGLRHK